MMMTPAGWPVTTTRFGQVSKPLNKLINEMGAATIERVRQKVLDWMVALITCGDYMQ